MSAGLGCEAKGGPLDDETSTAVELQRRVFAGALVAEVEEHGVRLEPAVGHYDVGRPVNRDGGLASELARAVEETSFEENVGPEVVVAAFDQHGGNRHMVQGGLRHDLRKDALLKFDRLRSAHGNGSD